MSELDRIHHKGKADTPGPMVGCNNEVEFEAYPGHPCGWSWEIHTSATHLITF